MKVLLTGASGFVGGHLLRELSGGRVRFVTAGRSVGSDIFVEDINGSTEWKAEHFCGVDAIVHLASHVHMMDDRNAARYFDVNRDGTVNFAKAAADAGVKTFIFISSIKAMGEQTLRGQPFRKDSRCRPSDPYGRSKYEAEKALLEIGEMSEMRVVCIRPPLVYGPGVGANFRSLLRLVASKVPLPLAGINNKRSMIFVRNLTDLIAHCLHIDCAKGIYLASDRLALSTSDLINEISLAMEINVRTFRIPSVLWRILGNIPVIRGRLDKLTRSLEIDCQETIKELGWVPPYSIYEGINETVESFKRDQG